MMRTSTEALLREIHRGEDTLHELKEVVFVGKRVRGFDARRLADGLAAFANA